MEKVKNSKHKIVSVEDSRRKERIQSFKKALKEYLKEYGLRDLPWRNTTDPYHILVSEIMLQQTQVPRVIEKYNAFLKKFPTVFELAKAPLSEVLILWSGLGYNRRAKYLKTCAEVVAGQYGGVFPKDPESLEKLPGIGPYTARAVVAFAYNIPSVLFETNIRTVFIYHFFSNTIEKLADNVLAPFVSETLDQKDPRTWYWLLMDYGSHLKSLGIKTHKKSRSFTTQKKFAGSFRQIRGGILKCLIQKPMTKAQLVQVLLREESQVSIALDELVAEKLIQKKGQKYFL